MSSKSPVYSASDYLPKLKLKDMPELLSVAQVCELLGISRQLVHRLIARGELAAIKVGPRTVRVFRSSLADYLNERADV
jgi:excisionase family DNA binding protein